MLINSADIFFHKLATSGVYFILTHVQLSDETSHVVVFKIQRENLLGKSCLVKYMEAVSRLKITKTRAN